MERLLRVEDIMERYGVTRLTALKYIHQMAYMEKPMRVTEEALRAWEEGRTKHPDDPPVKTRQRPMRFPVAAPGDCKIERRKA